MCKLAADPALARRMGLAGHRRVLDKVGERRSNYAVTH
jgi:hypothetical protein